MISKPKTLESKGDIGITVKLSSIRQISSILPVFEVAVNFKFAALKLRYNVPGFVFARKSRY